MWAVYSIAVVSLAAVFLVPVLPPRASTHATVLESIQQQINVIMAAIVRIQARIAELVKEQTAQTPLTQPTEEQQSKESPTEVAATSTTSDKPAASKNPLWRFIQLPSTDLTEPLVVLYHFSITAGTADATISSATFTITQADVSLKNLEVYAFSDEFFSVPAFLRNVATKRNRVARQIGYIGSNASTLSLLFDQGPPSVFIPAGQTYYFELRGAVVGKNRDAIVTVLAEGLSLVTLR